MFTDLVVAECDVKSEQKSLELAGNAVRVRDHGSDEDHRRRPSSSLQEGANCSKSRVRLRVGQPIRALKRVFGFRRVRYGGAKNVDRLFVASGLANAGGCLSSR